jgi:hypothetical protein
MQTPTFSFDIQNDYGDIKFNKLTPTYTYKEVDGSEKNYKGTVGSKGTSTIKIRLEYGNLEFRI